MQEVIIQKNQAGQRADKFLTKYLPEAQKSFIYKMMRKKNITLNDKKLTGNEQLSVGDSVKFYFSDETFQKFRGSTTKNTTALIKKTNGKQKEFRDWILYEDADIIFMNKPAGILSQKANPADVSMNEYMLEYLYETQEDAAELYSAFRPSICNRLDRNTTGLLIGGKSLPGVQELSRVLRERCVHKYYLCIVKGVMTQKARLTGYLKKEAVRNKVTIYETKQPDTEYICTEYAPLGNNGHYTLLKVLLVTGKPHQIRAHLSSIGHPILGDGKYGNQQVNQEIRMKYGVQFQLLHSYCLDFSEYQSISDAFSYLEGTSYKAQPDATFLKVLLGEQLHEYLE